MQVITSKVQYAPIEHTDVDGTSHTSFIRLGVYVEFDDSHAILCPDKQVRRGTGTIARYNFKHGTWSVQAPQRCQQTRMGYVFVRNEPVWEDAGRVRGRSEGEFRREYSPSFVQKCMECLVLGY